MSNCKSLWSGLLKCVASLAMSSLTLLAGFSPATLPRADYWAVDGSVYSILITNGVAYLGGSFRYIGQPVGGSVVVDLTAGQPDLGMPVVNGAVLAAVPDATGGFYIGGSFTAVGGSSRANLAHIKADRTVDPAWQPSASLGTVSVMTIAGNTVYLGGTFTRVGSSTRNHLAAVDATTGVVTAWDPNPTGSVQAITVRGSRVFVGGSFILTNALPALARTNLASIDAASGSATSWNPRPNGAVNALVVSDTTLFVGGSFTSIGGADRTNLAAIQALSSTASATAWRADASGEVTRLALSGTTLYAAGRFTDVSGQVRPGLAALDSVTAEVKAWNPQFSGTVAALAASDTTVFVGGSFTSIGSESRNNAAAFDGVTGVVKGWNPNLGNSVRSIVLAEATAYVGGDFALQGGQYRDNLAAVDVQTGRVVDWSAGVGRTLDDTNRARVEALATFGSNIYVGGSFTLANGTGRTNLAAVDLSTGQLLPWNAGTEVTNSEIWGLAVWRNSLAVGGTFKQIGTESRAYLGSVDLATGAVSDWTPNPSDAVWTLTASGDTLYAGGSFRAVAGEARSGIAAFDANTGGVTDWDPSCSGHVYAIQASDQAVYVGGQFTTIGAEFRTNFAAVGRTDGVALTNWNLPANARVLSLNLSGDTLYVGGDFSTIAGQPRSRLAQISVTNSQPTLWTPLVNNSVRGIASADGLLLAAGGFTSVGTQAQPGLAAFREMGLASLSGQVLTSGLYQLRVTGNTGEKFAIDSAPDLLSTNLSPLWTPVRTNVLVNSATTFTDPDVVTNKIQRFYRARYIP